MKIRTGIVWAAIFFAVRVSPQQTKRSMIANGNFEEGFSHWRYEYANGADVAFLQDIRTPLSGKKSLKVVIYQPGEEAGDSQVYTMFPVEYGAKYKLIFKAKANKEVRLSVVLGKKHSDFRCLTATRYPESFVSSDPGNSGYMDGTIRVGTEMKEYVFYTDGTQLPDGGYMLAFRSGLLDSGTTVWYDDVKIARCDEGDWNGNLTPYGDFEHIDVSSDLYDHYHYQVTCPAKPAGQVAGDYAGMDENGINGRSFKAYLGASTEYWDFAAWWCYYGNENAAYTHFFTAKADKEGAWISVRSNTCPNNQGSGEADFHAIDPYLTPVPQSYILSNRMSAYNAKYFGHSSGYKYKSGTKEYSYDGLHKMYISFSAATYGQEDITFWIDDYEVYEDNLYLKDFEIVNPPAYVRTGEEYLLKVGEFVKPTHAPSRIYYEIVEGGDCATIDDEGLIKGLKAGHVRLLCSDKYGNVEKYYEFDVDDGSGADAVTRDTEVFVYPAVVSANDKIRISAKVDLKVCNESGNLLFCRENVDEVSAGSFSPSAYIFVCRKEDKMFVRKIVVK